MLSSRARRELARATAAANAATNPKDTAAEAVLPSQPPPSTTDAAVQADAPTPLPTADAAVQAVVQTIEEAVQAVPPPHQCEPSQGVVVLQPVFLIITALKIYCAEARSICQVWVSFLE